MSATALAVFDGQVWNRDPAGADRFQIPALIDSGVSLNGYRESPNDPVTRATDAIGAGLMRFGVAALLDSGSSLESSYRLAASAPSLTVVRGGPVLTDSAAVVEADRQISGPESLRRAVAGLCAEGSTFIHVRTSDASFLRAVVDECASRARVSVRGGGIAPLAAADSGASLIYGASRLAGPDIASAHPLLELGQREAKQAIAHARLVAQSEIAVATGMLAMRRAAFPREAIEARYLEDLVPIFPHTRYLLEMKRRTGYLAGRRHLTAHTGAREPSPAERRVMERGWELLLDVVREFVDADGLLLPASLGPSLGVVPGYGLKEEVTLLAHSVGSIDTALRAATSTAASFLGIELVGQLGGSLGGVHLNDIALSATIDDEH